MEIEGFKKRAEVKSMFRATGSESPMEAELYCEFLKVGLRGEKQYSVGPFFADIAFPEYKIVVEYDGEAYHQNKQKDNERDVYFEKYGWTIFRVNKFNWKLGICNAIIAIERKMIDLHPAEYSAEKLHHFGAEEERVFVPIGNLLLKRFEKNANNSKN